MRRSWREINQVDDVHFIEKGDDDEEEEEEDFDPLGELGEAEVRRLRKWGMSMLSTSLRRGSLTKKHQGRITTQ